MNCDLIKSYKIIRYFSVLLRVVTAFIFFVVAISLIPSEKAYASVSYVLSFTLPIAQASEHIRSGPRTVSSLLFESLQDKTLSVAGVDINLNYAVNPSDRINERVFRSESLAEDRTFWVYLPPGYEESNNRFPSLYLLHGMSQNHRWWAEVARIDKIVTVMIEAERIRPVIIVMPNGNFIQSDVSTTSLYDNKCETGLDIIARGLKALGNLINWLSVYKVSCQGDFERYIAQDLIEAVDSEFRTSDERYLGGFSIGGRGAIQLAIAHGDAFSGAFGLSGNYNYIREGIRNGTRQPAADTKLFIAAGNMDQRGIYGNLNNFLFHEDMNRSGIKHVYCIFKGTHNATGWISMMPIAMETMLRPKDSNTVVHPGCVD